MKTTRTPTIGSTRSDLVFCAIALAAALTLLLPLRDANSTRSVPAAGTALVVPLHDEPVPRGTDRADGGIGPDHVSAESRGSARSG